MKAVQCEPPQPQQCEVVRWGQISVAAEIELELPFGVAVVHARPKPALLLHRRQVHVRDLAAGEMEERLGGFKERLPLGLLGLEEVPRLRPERGLKLGLEPLRAELEAGRLDTNHGLPQIPVRPDHGSGIAGVEAEDDIADMPALQGGIGELEFPAFPLLGRGPGILPKATPVQVDKDIDRLIDRIAWHGSPCPWDYDGPAHFLCWFRRPTDSGMRYRF